MSTEKQWEFPHYTSGNSFIKTKKKVGWKDVDATSDAEDDTFWQEHVCNYGLHNNSESREIKPNVFNEPSDTAPSKSNNYTLSWETSKSNQCLLVFVLENDKRLMKCDVLLLTWSLILSVKRIIETCKDETNHTKAIISEK